MDLVRDDGKNSQENSQDNLLPNLALPRQMGSVPPKQKASAVPTFVGLCQQVGITTECTYKSLHDAMDSIPDEPNEELVP